MSDPNQQDIARESTRMAPVAVQSPESPAERVQPLATETPSEPSVVAGATGLAWWDSDKYYWRNNASGYGAHLAPQDTYITDVIDRADHYISRVDISEDDRNAHARIADLLTEIIQEFEGLDTSGIEGLAWRRFVLSRSVIARKIAGVSAVSSEQRVMHELSLPNGDVEKLKSDSEGYYQSDIEKRDRWAEKTCVYDHLTTTTADGEVIPTDQPKLKELVEARISRSLYDDAVERGNKLKRPAPQAAANANKPSREELLAMTA